MKAPPEKPVVRRRGLNRGLEALLSTRLEGAEGSVPAATPREAGSGLYPNLPLDTVYSGLHQPRRAVDENALEELAQSIRAQGVIEPIIVRPRESGGYEIVAGERRWRAAQLAGLETIPAVVRSISDRDAMAVALIENIQREDLNALEEAEGLKRLIEEHSLTQQEVADAVGKSRTAVANLLRLLKLAPEARELLLAGSLEMGHARALLSLPNASQASVAAQVISHQLTVRATEALVRRLLGDERDRRTPKAKSQTDPDTRRLERELGEHLGAPVSIGFNQRTGAGRVVIRYASMDELDGILKHLRRGR